MTRDETKKIIMILTKLYPNFKADDLTGLVDAWAFFLADYEYNDIQMALKAYVASESSGFAPSINQLIALTHKTDVLNDMSEAEAWSKVSTAIRRSTYYSVEEFDKLPPDVQKAVGSAAMLKVMATDDNYDESVSKGQFLRAYRNQLARKHDIMTLPPEMRIQVKDQLAIGTADED